MKLQNTLGLCMGLRPGLTTKQKGVVEVSNADLVVGGYKITGVRFSVKRLRNSDWLAARNENRHSEFIARSGKFYWTLEECNYFMPGDLYTHSAFTSKDKQLGGNYQTPLLTNSELWMPNGHEAVMSFKQKRGDINPDHCVTANGLRYMLTPVPDFVQKWL